MTSQPPLKLGTPTRWGKIASVGCRNGERYYMMVDKHKCVTLMPAGDVEAEVKAHDFQYMLGASYRCCAICGIVERRDGKNSPCKGPSKLRPMEGA